MKKSRFTVFVGITAAIIGTRLAAAEYSADIVIYGSTPAALSAAVQAKRMGRSAIVVSPETRVGGLTTGGLGQTDIGNKAAFGGIALEFYTDVAKWYADEKHWKYQKSSEYFPDGQCAGSKNGGSMWTFEPSAALAILEGWEKRDGLCIRRGERLVRSSVPSAPSPTGVVKEGGRIVRIRTEPGNVYRGKMFVDATYEGDLLAEAGVSYTVGREANSVYCETISGCQFSAEGSGHHNFSPWVSAYVKPGDRSSGLLPGIEPYDAASQIAGAGDRRVQAYCFRMCLTDVEENRIPFVKPEGYDEKDYELLFREFEAVWAHPEYSCRGCVSREQFIPFIMSRMPNGKTDSNNRTGFSSDFIGRNWNWPEASYAERERILKAHHDYQTGLMWTLANHPRIPAEVRAYFSKWGMCRDEFADGLGGGWQRQLYVREARRMVGDYVMTEANCRAKKVAERPVAMAAYTMDSHHVRRVETKDGFVRNEGNVEDHGFAGPYPVDYGAIIPKRGECANLLVPVCVSASHMAFGSIRMEPVFFALGQAAATAAALAIEDGVTVQDLAYPKLAARLRSDRQVLGLGGDRAAKPSPAEQAAAEQAARMQWWTDARFGMFIHFGLYAAPARHEWMRMYERFPASEYDRLYLPRFNPDLFDARKWVRAAKAAGMKYMVLTTKHHEGFCMWDTAFSDYKITNTAFGRDLVREYVDACREEGMRVGFYFSLIDWHHPDFTIDTDHPMFPFNLAKNRNDTGYADESPELDAALAKLNAGKDFDRYRREMFSEIRELLTKYGKIDILFYDFTYGASKYGKSAEDWHSREILKMTRELQPGIIINDRLGLTAEGGFDILTPEQVVVPECPKWKGRDAYWEVCQTFSGSWGYHRDQDTWKSPEQLLAQLIDGVSKKGNLLLNVGPTARGEFDYRARERLEAMGKWMHRHSRSIYGCTAAPEEFRRQCPEGCKLTYNPKTDRLYLHVLEWPIKVLPLTFADRVEYAQLLNDASEVKLKIPLSVSGVPRKDVPASLLLPVRKPDVAIPVVEMFLKAKPAEPKTAGGPAGMFPFLIRPDASGSAADVSAYVKAPAGRDGFIRREGEKFVNDAGEFRVNGVNFTGAANFPTHAEADRLAPQLRRLGINCVRMHLIDWVAYGNCFQTPQQCLFRGDAPGMREVDPGRLDRLLYLIAALKKSGVYINMNLHAGRQLGPADGFQQTCWANRGVDFFNGQLIEAEKAYAKWLLSYVNPYTGLALKDDPTMALVELNNENALMQVWWSKTLVNQKADPCYTEEFKRLRAAAGYGEGVEDTNRFIMETEKSYFREMKEYLVKDLGVRCPVYGTQLDYTAPWVMGDTCDAIDAHIYWGHPAWKLPEGVGDHDEATHTGRARGIRWSFRNSSIADAELAGDYGNPIVTRGCRRVKGLPFISSECSAPYPAWYGSEFQPMIHAYGAFQGWAGLFVYSWNNAEEAFPDHNPFFFSYTARPDCLAHFPACAAMFLRGGVKGAKERIDIPVDREARLHSVTNRNYYDLVVVNPGSETRGRIPDAVLLEHAVAMDLGAGAGPRVRSPQVGKPAPRRARTYASDTGELFLDWTPDSNCVFRVDTPNVKFVSGHIDGRRIEFGDGVVVEPGRTANGWCAISVTAVDGRGFVPGARLLVAATGYTHNGGAKYTKFSEIEWGGTGAGELGSGKMVTEGVPFRLTLPFVAECRPLDESGAAKPGPAVRGREFELGPRFRTVWYECRCGTAGVGE